MPKRAYLPKGTLRDQIIYPDVISKMTDDQLYEILDLVKLTHFAQSEEKFDIKKEWVDILSGGERQRITFARVFYHCPKFAILDECTSAVSADFEGVLYEYLLMRNITLLTISQRSSLFDYHDYLLKFDGTKNWTFEQIIHKRN